MSQPIDDRVIFFQVRWRPEGPAVDGGYNEFWDALERPKKKAILEAALMAVVTAGALMLGDDEILDQVRQTYSGFKESSSSSIPGSFDAPPPPSKSLPDETL